MNVDFLEKIQEKWFLFQRFVTSIVTEFLSWMNLNRTDTLDNNEEGSEADDQNCWKRCSKILPVD